MKNPFKKTATTASKASSSHKQHIETLPRLWARHVMQSEDNGLGRRFVHGADYSLVKPRMAATYESRGYKKVAEVDEVNTPGIDFYLMEAP